jgi:hypothetical protein
MKGTWMNRRADGTTQAQLSAAAFMTTAILERIRTHDRADPRTNAENPDGPLVTNDQPDVWAVRDPTGADGSRLGEVHEVNGRFETLHQDGEPGYTFDTLRRAVAYLDDYAYVCRQWL